MADLSGSYRLVFFATGGIAALAAAVAWLGVTERFSPVPGGGRPSVLRGLVILAQTPGLLPIFITTLAAQFGVRTVQPIVTPFVQQLSGPLPSLATLAGFGVLDHRRRRPAGVALPWQAPRQNWLSPCPPDQSPRRGHCDLAAGVGR